MKPEKMLEEITEDNALEMLAVEYKHNKGKFIYHKGSPRRMRAMTTEGQLYLDICEAIRVSSGMSMDKAKFYYACNNKAFV